MYTHNLHRLFKTQVRLCYSFDGNSLIVYSFTQCKSCHLPLVCKTLPYLSSYQLSSLFLLFHSLFIWFQTTDSHLVPLKPWSLYFFRNLTLVSFPAKFISQEPPWLISTLPDIPSSPSGLSHMSSAQLVMVVIVTISAQYSPLPFSGLFSPQHLSHLAHYKFYLFS